MKIIHGDCLRVLPTLNENSIDFVCADLPYGVTQNRKDVQLPLDELWKEYWRVLKPNGCVALYAQGLFYVDLVQSCRRYFRYDLIWDKVLTSGFLNAKRMPLRSHEQVAIFYKRLPTYNPQFTEGKPLHSRGHSYKEKELTNNNYGEFGKGNDDRKGSTQKYPKSILTFPKPHPSISKHRTEKSIKCSEWLIKTYTNENEVVLDNTAGSMTMGIACLNTNRRCILIEKDLETFLNGKRRIEDHCKK